MSTVIVLVVPGWKIAAAVMAAFWALQCRVCQTCVWQYSRHPNYFFESTIWIGNAVFAPSPWGAIVRVPDPDVVPATQRDGNSKH